MLRTERLDNVWELVGGVVWELPSGVDLAEEELEHEVEVLGARLAQVVERYVLVRVRIGVQVVGQPLRALLHVLLALDVARVDKGAAGVRRA